jgi:putative transcriptional regulator
VSHQAVIAMEPGKYSPSLESAFRIARVSDTDFEAVFGWEGPPRRA